MMGARCAKLTALYANCSTGDHQLVSLQVDLDLGNYERFLDITLTRENNITTGKIYQAGVLGSCFIESTC